MELYHGTDEKFKQFKGNKVFATSDIEFARRYGQYIAVINYNCFFECVPEHPIEFVNYYPETVEIKQWID